MSEEQRIKLARIVAGLADLLEIVIFPAFVQGALSPVNDVVDVVTGAVLLWLLGWHWALLPAFAAELVPFVTLAPTWSAAVYIVTRNRLAGAPPAPPGRPDAIEAEARPVPERRVGPERGE